MLRQIPGFDPNAESGSGIGDAKAVREELERTLEQLKEIQKNRSSLTRPNGTVAPQTGINDMFQKFFGADPVFGGTQNLDPNDY